MALPVYRPAQSASGAHPRIRPHVSGAAITANTFVKKSTDGYIDPCADPAVVANGILGLALNAASGAGEVVLVCECTPDQVYSGKVDTGTWTVADEGKICDLNSTGLDIDLTTAPTAMLIGLDETDDDSSGTRRVLFSIINTVSQAPGGGKGQTA